MEPDAVKKKEIYNAAVSEGLRIVAERSPELYRISVKRQFATARQNAEAKIEGRSPFERRPLTLRNAPEESATVRKPAQPPVTQQVAPIAAQSAQTVQPAQPAVPIMQPPVPTSAPQSAEPPTAPTTPTPTAATATTEQGKDDTLYDLQEQITKDTANPERFQTVKRNEQMLKYVMTLETRLKDEEAARKEQAKTMSVMLDNYAKRLEYAFNEAQKKSAVPAQPRA